MPVTKPTTIGRVIVTLRRPEIEHLLLETSDGPVTIEIKPRSRRASIVRIVASTAINVSRRKVAATQGDPIEQP